MAKTTFGFAFTFMAFFALSYVFLAWADALPEPIDTTDEAPAAQEVPVVTVSTMPELPVRVVAAAIGLDEPVANPASTDVEELDAELLKGTVRYPTSAMLGVDGTVLLFGHSSYLPIVRNQNFKAFNGIQKLKQGATISVYSGTTEYRYAVSGVRVANAKEDVVQLPSNGKYLTLVTCDSFGSKSDRYVVTAEFVGAYAL